MIEGRTKNIGALGDLVAADAREQLRRWDAGESVWSIEMGGIGPGYEQAIQVLAIEIVRDNIDRPLPGSSSRGGWGDSTVARVDVRLPNGKYSCGGFSGAQVGAAKNLAYILLKYGPRIAREMADEDRHILVSRTWPRAPEPPKDDAELANGGRQ